MADYVRWLFFMLLLSFFQHIFCIYVRLFCINLKAVFPLFRANTKSILTSNKRKERSRSYAQTKITTMLQFLFANDTTKQEGCKQSK